MNIDLRACQTLVISLRDDDRRRASAAALCDRLGLDWRFVDAIRCQPGSTGCGLSHIRALRLADPDRPVLILEDDVLETEAFDASITTPADADAAYLGTSWFGALDEPGRMGAHGVVAAEPVSDAWFRSHNMLSTHAILYLSAAYRAAAVEAIVAALTVDEIPPDSGLAAIHSDFKIYGLTQPAFYQAAALQTAHQPELQEAATRTPVEILPVNMVVILKMQPTPRKAILVRDGDRLAWRYC